MNITDLPPNAFVGVMRSDRPGDALSLPADPKYGNHLGTVHAGALLALAEATSGDYLLTRFTDLAFEVVPVVRRLEAKFKKPATGALHASAKVGEEGRADFVSTLSARGRALLQIEVELTDADGTAVLLASVEWFVVKK